MLSATTLPRLVASHQVTEETASSLLLDEFTAEQCSAMFYTKPPVEFAERTHKLHAVLKAAASLPQDRKTGVG